MNKKYGLIQKLTKFVPPSIRALLREYISFTRYDLYVRAKSDLYINDPPCSDFPDSPYTLGIIKEFAHYHKVYIAACREMGISYKVLDISGTDWIHLVRESACDAFLIWPSSILTIWKEMYDDRLRIMEEELGLLIYPTYHEAWLYENKRRVRDWLEAHNIPHPNTWIYYNEDEAFDFIKNADLPIVIKSNTGASASGVYIMRNRAKAIYYIRNTFRKGIITRRRDPRDRQWGVIYIQEYIPNVKEWRMVRIGNSYFGHLKKRVGEFHSGSGAYSWSVPPRTHFDFLKKVTEVGNFSSMNVDIFETESGRLLVNELHTVFGAGFSVDQLRINDNPGRYIFDIESNKWCFEAGDFSRNMCANARIDYLINSVIPESKK